MSPGTRNDPYLSYNFAVEIESVIAGGFNEVSGLQAEIEIQEYREGGLNGFVHKRAGPTKYASNLVLKKGLIDAKALWQWFWQVSQGIIERKNISVVLLDSAGGEKRRWNFEQAYPVKWAGPGFRATGNEVAMETVEFAHNGLSRG